MYNRFLILHTTVKCKLTFDVALNKLQFCCDRKTNNELCSNTFYLVFFATEVKNKEIIIYSIKPVFFMLNNTLKNSLNILLRNIFLLRINS